MTGSADPDQLASEEANWSGSTLSAKAGHIQLQQDKDWRGLDLPVRFFPIVFKRENICNFLFVVLAPLEKGSALKKKLLPRKRICSKGEQIIYF